MCWILYDFLWGSLPTVVHVCGCAGALFALYIVWALQGERTNILYTAMIYFYNLDKVKIKSFLVSVKLISSSSHF